MSRSFDHTTYLSPFSWRYGSPQMRTIWSEEHNRLLWRRLWVALAEAQHQLGLVTAEQLEDLRQHAEAIDIERSLATEAEIQHDVMAEIRTFADQCSIGGGIIHLGATSMDIKDNADALRLREALEVIVARLAALLDTLADQIERWAHVPTIAFTHLQPAEPTTIGYRLAQYGLDLLIDYQDVLRRRDQIRGKGFRGAVGTSASYHELLQSPERMAQFERHLTAAIGLAPFPVATQTYPRKQDWLVLSALAGVAGSLYKFAFDLRLLQSPPVGEWAEPFGAKQVGSSAMPFKRNPIHAENIDSLARYVAALPRVAWDNAAHSLLERTLDDSANRREVLPGAFLATDEIIGRATRLVGELRIDETAVGNNLTRYGAFAATERVLMAAVKAGADRQTMHEVIREHSLAAWAQLAAGGDGALAQALATDTRVSAYVAADQVHALMDAHDHVGNAPAMALDLAAQIRSSLTRQADNKP